MNNITETLEVNKVKEFIEKNINDKILYAEDRWLKGYENQFTLMKLIEEEHHFKFVITDQEVIIGQITNQIGESKEDVLLLQKAERKTKDDDLEYFNIFIGSSYDGRKSKIVNKITWKVYKYLFVTNENQKIILLSPDKLDAGAYTISGNIYHSKDTKTIGDTKTILVEQSIFLPHKDEIIPLKLSFNRESATEFIKKVNVEDLKIHLFNNKRHQGDFEMFENLILTWLFSGKVENYPLHFIWVGESGCGKSIFLEMLWDIMQENQDIIEGEISTIKGVVPSFRNSGGDCGAFQRALRIFLIDEFLRMIERSRSQGGQEGMIVSSTLSMMNSMLEHKRKLATSGNGKIPVDVKSKCFFATNDFKNSNTLNNLLIGLNEMAFASRFLWYYTSKEHLKYLQDNQIRSDKKIESPITNNEFLALFEYYQNNSIEITDEIEKNVKKIIKSADFDDSLVKDLFKNTRTNHHFLCILDGCRKLRQIQENEMAWEISEKDYKMASEVYNFVIKSWGFNVLKGVKYEE